MLRTKLTHSRFVCHCLRLLCQLILGSLTCASAQAKSTDLDHAPSHDDGKAVTVTTRRQGDVTHFYVENQELCEVTMTFDMHLVELKGTVCFPYTATFPAGQVTEAFCLAPSQPEAKWEYSYTNYFKLGSNCAHHDDTCVYELPYGPGEKYPVTQGYNGQFSHKGSNLYATDWKMPQGTLVRAARGGLVVRVKEDSNKGGGSIKYDRYNNYVLIRHEDGTLAHYCHLQKNGCLVKVGQVVVAGQPIAHSGNTGFSSGPHLHFCVFKAKNGRERESIPVKFRTATDQAITLLEDHTYRAPVEHVDAPKTEARAQGATATP